MEERKKEASSSSSSSLTSELFSSRENPSPSSSSSAIFGSIFAPPSKVLIPNNNINVIDKHYAVNGNVEHCTTLYEECLRNLVKVNIIPISPKTGYPQFQGMGHDSHMASLFPGHPQINEKKKWVTHITNSPKPPPKRITMTLPVINSSLYNLMVVCDKEYAHAVAEIMKHNNMSLPSAHLSAKLKMFGTLTKQLLPCSREPNIK